MHSRKCTIDTLFFFFLILVEVVHSVSVMIMFLCHDPILCLLVYHYPPPRRSLQDPDGVIPAPAAPVGVPEVP